MQNKLVVYKEPFQTDSANDSLALAVVVLVVVGRCLLLFLVVCCCLLLFYVDLCRLFLMFDVLFSLLVWCKELSLFHSVIRCCLFKQEMQKHIAKK